MLPRLLTPAWRVQALLNIISNPVNSTVPIAAAVLKAKGVYDPKRLFGVTTLDLVCHSVLTWGHMACACAACLAQDAALVGTLHVLRAAMQSGRAEA